MLKKVVYISSYLDFYRAEEYVSKTKTTKILQKFYFKKF